MYKKASPKTEKHWKKFIDDLSEINRKQQVLSIRAQQLNHNIQYCTGQNPEKICPFSWGSGLTKMNDYSIALDKQVSALNHAYMLTQRGLAFITPSSNDLSIVTPEGVLPDDVIEKASFRSDKLPNETTLDGWFIPVIIVAGTITVVALVTNALTSTKEIEVKQQKLNIQLQKLNTQAHKDMSSNPDIYQNYTDYLKNVKEPTDSIISDILNSGSAKVGGGIVAAGLVLIAGYFIFSKLGKNK
jgi:hypothetical protein